MPQKGSRAPKAKAKSVPKATVDADQSKKRLNHKAPDADAESASLTSALACLDKFKLVHTVASSAIASSELHGSGAAVGSDKIAPTKVDKTSPAESSHALVSELPVVSHAPKAKSKSAPRAKADADQSKKRSKPKTTDGDAGAAHMISVPSTLDKSQLVDVAESSAVMSSKLEGLGANIGDDETPPTKVAKISSATSTAPPVSAKTAQDSFSKALDALDNLAYRRPHPVARV